MYYILHTTYADTIIMDAIVPVKIDVVDSDLKKNIIDEFISVYEDLDIHPDLLELIIYYIGQIYLTERDFNNDYFAYEKYIISADVPSNLKKLEISILHQKGCIDINNNIYSYIYYSSNKIYISYIDKIIIERAGLSPSVSITERYKLYDFEDNEDIYKNEYNRQQIRGRMPLRAYNLKIIRILKGLLITILTSNKNRYNLKQKNSLPQEIWTYIYEKFIL